jgi:threonyl-tRNA synthetase
MQKVPYMAVVGDREVEEGTVSVRARSRGDLGGLSRHDAVALVAHEVALPVVV